MKHIWPMCCFRTKIFVKYLNTFFYICCTFIAKIKSQQVAIYACSFQKTFCFTANFNICKCKYYNTYQICVITFHQTIYSKTLLIKGNLTRSLDFDTVDKPLQQNCKQYGVGFGGTV